MVDPTPYLQAMLSANAQRRAREKYLQALPPDISRYLEECDYITSPAYDSLAGSFLPYADGVGRSCFRPEGYQYIEYSWPEQIIQKVTGCASPGDDRPAYFRPSGGNPIYKIAEFGWVRKNLGLLWRYSPEELGVVAEDKAAGILISNYCGYLKEDPNPDEVVYELGIWGCPLRLNTR